MHGMGACKKQHVHAEHYQERKTPKQFPLRGLLLKQHNQMQDGCKHAVRDKNAVQLAAGSFDTEHRQEHGYNKAKAKTFSDARVTFTEEQVRKETARCLGCGATKVDPYLCVGCGICTTRCKFDAIHLKKVRDWHAGTFETMPIKAAANIVRKTGGIIKRAVKK